MMTDFYQSLGEEADVDRQIPQEILDELNKELPSNLALIQDKDGNCIAVPRPGRDGKAVVMTTQFDIDPDKDANLIERLKKIPQEKRLEYLYRIQKSVSVKNAEIGDGKQMVPMGKTVGNPFSDEEEKLVDCRMYPQKFADPFPLLFESQEGDEVTILFQQQIYDSLTEIKFCNINFSALKIEMYVYSPLAEDCKEEAKTSKNSPVSVTYSVTPTMAETVTDAVKALHIFSGLFSGETRVNGQMMVSEAARMNFEPQKVEDALAFWTAALGLEEIIGVHFCPGADFPVEDARFFSELDVCFNEKKEIVWKHPFDSFHVNGFESPDNNPDKIIDCGKLHLQFIEGPIHAKLLGAEFEIYSFTQMRDFVVTDIEWEDENRRSGEVYIVDAPGKTWTLKRLYITKQDADELKEKSKANKGR